MKTEKLIKVVFCAREQKETEHLLGVAPNGEVILKCECGEFLKFPAGIKKAELEKLLKVHKEVNEGQVTQESINSNLKELV